MSRIDQRLRELLSSKILPQVEPKQAHHVGHLAVLVQGAVAVLNGQEADALTFAASEKGAAGRFRLV